MENKLNCQLETRISVAS